MLGKSPLRGLFKISGTKKYLILLMIATCILVCSLNQSSHTTFTALTSVEFPFTVIVIYDQMLKLALHFSQELLMKPFDFVYNLRQGFSPTLDLTNLQHLLNVYLLYLFFKIISKLDLNMSLLDLSLGKRGLSQKANAISFLVLHKNTEYLVLNQVNTD